ncbi:MAG: hypothetical protein U9R08_02000 [Nanoarchaeota archaeon]|nr:hypothetical protein [Nanoarchaeota archaeon]
MNFDDDPYDGWFDALYEAEFEDFPEEFCKDYGISKSVLLELLSKGDVNFWDIIQISESGGDWGIVSDWIPNDSDLDIVEVYRAIKGSPEWYKGYDVTKFKKHEMAKLISNNVGLDANDYNSRFSIDDIINLSNFEVNSDLADEYPVDATTPAICLMKHFAQLPNSKEAERLHELFNKIFNLYGLGGDYQLLGTGATAVVLLRDRKAVKFSYGINREYTYLDGVRFACSGTQNNIVKLKGKVQQNIALEIEHIKGKPLGEIFIERRVVPRDTIRQYASGILNGILELRKAGIYHHDIHDRNIMIEQGGRAVIIDLGAASKNPEQYNPFNRAYGGNNDIISLGQLLYRMASGENLFKEDARNFTCYSECKDGIKTERERVYENPVLFRQYMNLIKKTVSPKIDKDNRVTELILTLLDADLWKQPDYERVVQVKKEVEECL